MNKNNEENGSHHCPVEDCSTHLQHDMQRNVNTNIDAAMIYVQFIWMTTSRGICVEREEIAKF